MYINPANIPEVIKSSTFDGNLDAEVNNLQTLAERVDKMNIPALAGVPATTAANDIQVGNGAGAWITKTLAQFVTILRTSLDSIYAATAKGVTNGDSHDHAGGDGNQIAYANLSGKPTLGTIADNAETDFAVAAKGVTNGDSHDHNGGDGNQIAYSGLSGLPALGTIADNAETDFLAQNATKQVIIGEIQTLADDTVYSFTPPAVSGMISVYANTAGGAAYRLLANFRCTTSGNFIEVISAGANVVTGTGALTNGTANGTDLKFNVNTHTDGLFYLKNRAGTQYNFIIKIL